MTTREAVARGLLEALLVLALLLLGLAARVPAQEISWSWNLGAGEAQQGGSGQAPLGPATAVRVDESLGGSRVRIEVDPGPVVRLLAETAWEEGSFGRASALVTIADEVVLRFQDLLGSPIVDIPFTRFSFDLGGTRLPGPGVASFFLRNELFASAWGIGGSLQYPHIRRAVQAGDPLNQTYHSEVLGPDYTARFLPLPAWVEGLARVDAESPGFPLPQPAGSARVDLFQAWGGLTPIDAGGEPVPGVVITALSSGGTDWALPAPEPAGGALGLAAAAALAGLRARQGRTRAAAR